MHVQHIFNNKLSNLTAEDTQLDFWVFTSPKLLQCIHFVQFTRCGYSMMMLHWPVLSTICGIAQWFDNGKSSVPSGTMNRWVWKSNRYTSLLILHIVLSISIQAVPTTAILDHEVLQLPVTRVHAYKPSTRKNNLHTVPHQSIHSTWHACACMRAYVHADMTWFDFDVNANSAQWKQP